MNNTKDMVDLLDEDKPIAEQKFACLSFVSPEKILKQKDQFLFEKFVQNYDFAKSMEKFNQFLQFIIFKYNLNSDEITKDFKEFSEEEKQNLTYDVSDNYKTFLDNHEERFTQVFQEKHQFQTNTRGIKIRGVFPTQQEAELRCKMLRNVDPNHDVYVGPVGLWLPFDPDAYKTGKVEYLEKELNELMHEKTKNEIYAKEKFEQRVKESKLAAIEDNIKKAKENNTTLTQSINEKGELINVKNMNTQEDKVLGANATGEEIRKELFEGDNIVMDKNSDHGLTELIEKYNKEESSPPSENNDLESSE